MNDELKKRLAAYEKGELPPEQIEEFEAALEKREKLSNEEQLQNSNAQKKKQQRIIKRGKWMSRFRIVLTIIGVFILFTVISTLCTAFYYTMGKPDRGETLRNIVDYSITITNPYGYLSGSSSNTKPYFGMTATRDLQKVIGDETIKVAEVETNFFFSLMAVPKITYMGAMPTNHPAFIFPGSTPRGFSGWKRLEKFHEGTVVSAYVSFSELLSTEQVFSLFDKKDMRIVWLPVDTGSEKKEKVITDSIGLPNAPIWHDDDMILESSTEEDRDWGTKIVAEGYSSPGYAEGDVKPLHEQFLKTLNFLKPYEKKVNNFYWRKLNLSERIQFLEKNGIKHYGVVITGPTKEVLKLKEEKIISDLELDEVDFWNWDSELNEN